MNFGLGLAQNRIAGSTVDTAALEGDPAEVGSRILAIDPTPQTLSTIQNALAKADTSANVNSANLNNANVNSASVSNASGKKKTGAKISVAGLCSVRPSFRRSKHRGKTNMLSRRLFLKSSGIAAFGAGIAPGWLARAADTSTGSRKKVLVAIFQRGAVDGLNLVVPVRRTDATTICAPIWRSPRPLRKLATMTRPSILTDSSGSIRRSNRFKPMFTSNVLAIVHAVGSPDPTRSHFDAQDYMESGTPGRKATSDGWLNRSLPTEAGPPTPMRAIGFGAELPRALRGANAALAVNNLNDFKVRDDAGAASFESMYASTLDAALAGTARETFEAVRTVEAATKANLRARERRQISRTAVWAARCSRSPS